MYCTKCGAQIPEGSAQCPVCNPVNPAPPPVQPIAPPQAADEKKAAGKGAKSYAALFSALMVLPAMLCTVINLVFWPDNFWAGYVLGALVVVWVFCVLPFLKITSPVTTAIICFLTVMGYMAYIASRTNMFDRFFERTMPLCLLACAFAAMDVALIGSNRVKGLHAVSLVMVQCSVYFMAWEAIRDISKYGEVNLRWSLIVSCFFISAIAISEAVSYIIRINKKK